VSSPAAASELPFERPQTRSADMPPSPDIISLKN
jgi:hypothetical protein